MTKLKQLRQRAINVLLDRGSENVPMFIDYVLDDWARDELSLPDRPQGQEPYKGWMPEDSINIDSAMVTSKVGVDLIKRWEGFRSKAYICPGNVWTIGYGHTANVSQGDRVTKLQAEQMLKQDLKVYEYAVREAVTVPLSQNQFDALVSFCYNVGVTAFQNSTLLRLLNQGQYSKIDKQFMRWVYAGRKRLQGLANRRREEAKLFNS